jgi:hypothetical protein
MKLTVKTNVAEFTRRWPALEKQIRFAAAVALTKTAKDVQAAMPSELDKVFDRPTPFTKQGTYTKAARRDALVAEIGFREIQAKYLQLQAEGGIYEPRDVGIRLPGNITLNAFGNIPRGMIAKLKEAAQNGELPAAVARRLQVHGDRRKANRGKPIELFFGVPQGKGWEGAPLGIWRRIEGTGGGPGKLVPIIVFEDTPAKYEQRLNLEKIAQPIVQANFDKNFDAALRAALASAR